MSTKVCPACGEDKGLDEFAMDKSRKSGRHTYCRSCDSIKRKRSADRKLAREQKDKINGY